MTDEEPLARALIELNVTDGCSRCGPLRRLRKDENGRWFCRVCWPRETPGAA